MIKSLLMSAVTLVASCVPAIAVEPVHETWDVEGVQREAWVYPPAQTKAEPAPLVFAFHGHGGAARQAARSFRVQAYWPEAIVVYMQGLPTPGRLTDPEGRRAGWQHAAGDQADRDLKFFDAVLQRVKEKYRVDEQRIYSMGHSNGGAFTYLLWATRGDVLAAVAPSGAAAGRLLTKLKPKPALHIAGESDELVKFDWQRRTIEQLKQLNQCAADGQREGQCLTRYESTIGAPFLTYVYPGGHRFPATDVMPVIVTFFQQPHRDKDGSADSPTVDRAP